MRRAAAVADQSVAAEAAEDLLLSGGSALGAVAAGFFAAAGATSGILLSPTSLLLSGVGIGSRAFDGRLRQPGLGTKRPRGFQNGEEIPDAARLAVPAGVPALLVALGYDESLRLARVTKQGIRRARDSGAEGRASVLEAIRGSGVRSLSDPAFIRPLLHVGGPAQGGLLTPADFQNFGELDYPAERRQVGDATVLVAPWVDDIPGARTQSDIGSGHAILAVDARGACAALAYRRVLDGINVDSLELEAPRAAIPVRRGTTRTAPGAQLPAPAPIAIALNAAGAPTEIRAWPSASAPFAPSTSTIGLRIDGPNVGVISSASG